MVISVSSNSSAVAEKWLRKYRNVEFNLGEIANLNSEEVSFDIVIVHFILHGGKIKNAPSVRNKQHLARSL